MAVTKSQGMCEAMLGRQSCVSIHETTLALDDGGGAGGEDLITDSGNGFLTAGFRAGLAIYILGATNGSNDIAGVVCTAVTAGVITLPSGTLAADQSSGTAFAVFAADGGGFRNLFTDGSLALYTAGSGVPLVDEAYNANGAVKLIQWDNVVLGSPTFESASDRGYINLTSTVSGTAVAGGTATWGRFAKKSNDINGASTSAIRFQFSAGAVTGDLILATASFNISDVRPLGTAKFYVYQANQS